MTSAVGKKHIDVVLKYFQPVTAGIETNVLETYSILAQEGWDVTIHTSKDVYLQKNALSDHDVIRGLAVKRYPFTAFGFFPEIDWDRTDAVCLHNFDIFPHLRILLYSLYRKILAKKKFALVLTPHGGFNPKWSTFPLWHVFVKWPYQYTFGTLLINAAVDGVRAVSEWERQAIIGKGVAQSRVVTISNGIEDEAYQDLDQLASAEMKRLVAGFGKYILQIGRVYRIKNYETAIRALANVQDKALKYVIAGSLQDRAYLRKLKSLVAELNLEDRVIFLGVVKGVDKYYLIKKAQIMVHMAIWESFCNVVNEGMSQGLVCLVADAYALPYLVQDGVNGYCLAPRDFTGLARKIDFVMTNKESNFIKSMEARNREYGLKDSWREVASRMDKFYQALIPGNSKAASPRTDTGDERMTVDGQSPKPSFRQTASGQRGPAGSGLRKSPDNERNQSTVSIVIPAHNEARNISTILQEVLRQRQDIWKLQEILVYCDGCTDETATKASAVRSDLVKVIVDSTRRGKASLVRSAFRIFQGDVLVILDADLRLRDEAVISNLLKPLLAREEVMLTSGNPMPFAPRTFLQRAIYASFEVFYQSRTQLKNGNNIFGCLGPCLALKRELTRRVDLPQDMWSEHSYIYLSCLKLGYKFQHVSEAVVFYKLASNLRDYLKQAMRSNMSIVDRRSRQHFGKLAQQEFHRPLGFYLRAVLRVFVQNPAEVLYIIFLNAIALIAKPFVFRKHLPYWEIVESTK